MSSVELTSQQPESPQEPQGEVTTTALIPWDEAQAAQAARSLVSLPEDPETPARPPHDFIESHQQHMLRLGNDVKKRDDLEKVQLYREGHYDSLTSLPNRLYFTKALSAEMAQHPGNFALIYMDLDGLKAANDTHGHTAGDQLIKNAATIAQASLRTEQREGSPPRELDIAFRFIPQKHDEQFVARLGGDEFVALVANVQREEEVTAIRKRIQDNLAAGGIQASLGGRVHHTGEDAEAFLAAVDALMYKEKQARHAAKEAQATPEQAEPL